MALLWIILVLDESEIFLLSLLSTTWGSLMPLSAKCLGITYSVAKMLALILEVSG